MRLGYCSFIFVQGFIDFTLHIEKLVRHLQRVGEGVSQTDLLHMHLDLQYDFMTCDMTEALNINPFRHNVTSDSVRTLHVLG